MLERKHHHTDADWRQYFCTVDAITSRNPRRVNQNCLDMLRAKVTQIHDGELRDDAWAEYGELLMRIEEAA